MVENFARVVQDMYDDSEMVRTAPACFQWSGLFMDHDVCRLHRDL